MILSLIAAIGKNNELGKSNQLLWQLPDDMKHFKELTSGRAVIMGRKTFESIGRTLPNRMNIIITTNPNFVANGAIIVSSLTEAIAKAKEDTDGEVFIIGGGMIYAEALPIADRLYLTHVDTDFPDADTFFPEVNCDEWDMVGSESHPSDDRHPYDFRYATYERKKSA